MAKARLTSRSVITRPLMIDEQKVERSVATEDEERLKPGKQKTIVY
jgi:hypothetical protein